MHIRPMTAADIPLGMRLKLQANWNQTEADWRRCLELQPASPADDSPAGSSPADGGAFVAECDGSPVATTATCVFDTVGWIALVLVDEPFRRRGIGNALMLHAIGWLENQGVRSIWLDATPLGQPLYERLGFTAEFELCRYHGRPCSTAEPASAVEPLSSSDWADCVQFDRAITGTNREKLLTSIFAAWPDAARMHTSAGELQGFIAARRGANAVQIGPCLAEAKAGPSLLADAWRRFAGQDVFIDIPTAHSTATERAKAAGLTVQRPLLRMRRGEPVAYDLARLWASSGPEKG
jgi:GNAT superfamily N-acetyltransferase